MEMHLSMKISWVGKFFCGLTCILFWGKNVNGQIFHFEDTSANLVLSTAQTPAHWYLKVVPDITMDSVLRWKAVDFLNVPTGWKITFDDQRNFHDDVHV